VNRYRCRRPVGVCRSPAAWDRVFASGMGRVGSISVGDMMIAGGGGGSIGLSPRTSCEHARTVLVGRVNGAGMCCCR